ncbi:exocyst complex component EXO70 [Phanerochaete sordida]|uniref:Exocyst complex protein EXO70 n=1 Tax=Phanerochaete sordida TaxID=48140 RepID=A0A9P3GR88_9APHY|nr:exocyst complex component EXO70 [Phanerochaete sordida]
MDDETAEIELLEQNLNKTRQISQRMTSILSSFDTRLVKLEKTILPLYNSTQVLTRRATNIEAALQKIDEVASNQEGIAAEEALILRGPQPGQLETYKDVLERLNASVAFKSLDRDVRDTARLVETGAKKLTQLYTKMVAEGSSGAPPNGPDFELSPFPPSLKPSLVPLVTFLRQLPLPATHPSHPAAPAIQSTLKEAQKGYADMRGSWGKKCLENYARRVVDRAETIDGVAAGREFGAWVANLLTVAEEEYDLLLELAPLPTQSVLSTTFATLITPLVNLFSTTLSSLSGLIKRSLHKYTFLALSAYASLSSLQARWDDVMCRRSGRKENELKDGLHSIRAACLRSFPEFLADLQAAALGKGGELSTGLADFTLSTVQYVERLPEVREAVGAALLTLGDGNWKMGQGVQVGKAPKSVEIDEQTVLEHYTFDVINTVLGSLTTLSRTNKRPAFGSIFLLNNVSYIRTRLLVAPRTDVRALLSKPTQDVLTSTFRTAKAGYFDSNFSPLMQTLLEDKDRSKSATKEKFTRFFDALEEVAERHRLARVLQDDRDGRETIKEEAVKLVVPSLQRFTQRQGKEFSKNPQKYIKMSAEEVENLIRGFYAGSDGGGSRLPPVTEQAQNNLLIQAGWSR